MMAERRARQAMIAIVVTFCILGVIYSIATPLFEAPDEIWHFSFVRTLAAERSLPEQSADVKDMWLREAGQPPLYYLLAALVVAPLDTTDFPSWVRFNVAHPAVTAHSESDALNMFIHTRREAFPYRGTVLAVHLVRLLSVLWGATTVVGAYLVAREVVPDRPRLALATAAITAFNPHFVFISSVVNNDVCAACLCTFGLWLSVRAVRETAGPPIWLDRNLVSLGLVTGLAMLAKMSALALVALVLLALGLIWLQDRDARSLLVRGVVILSSAGLVGAWWYIRNWVLYGDPLAWNVWMLDLASVPVDPIELVRQIRHVGTSYWAPYDRLFAAPVFWALGLMAAVATAGWVKLIVRHKMRAEANTQGLLLVGTWFVILFASLIKYMMTTPSDEGRLLFPGIAAFSLLLSLGLDAVTLPRWEIAPLGIVGAGLVALSVATPFFAIAPRFALPLISSPDELSIEIPFSDGTFPGARLLGMDVQDVADPGETVRVVLYWEAQPTTPADLRAVVQVWTVGGRLVGQRDKIAAGEIYPPDLWRAGDVVRDEHLVLTAGNGPTVCRVSVRVLAGNKLLGEVSSPIGLKIEGQPISVAHISRPVKYTLAERIELIGYDAPTPWDSRGGPIHVTLYWRVLAELDQDYTVFVHVLDQDGGLTAQSDGQPLNNDYPTSHWLPGEVLADTHVVSFQGQVPRKPHLLVGLYRLADGVRLPVYTAQGDRVPNDAIALYPYN